MGSMRLCAQRLKYCAISVRKSSRHEAHASDNDHAELFRASQVEEPNGGDYSRFYPVRCSPPSPRLTRRAQPVADHSSATFHALNRGKVPGSRVGPRCRPTSHETQKSVVLDLKEKNDRERFLELARGADVVLESFRPGAASPARLPARPH
jgi:hypothetical protein